MKTIRTKHGEIGLPNFFPTIGYPGGRGEYDYFFRNVEYFCRKFNHYHFLYNFSNFMYGFTIPKNDFNSDFQKKYINKDIRDIITDNTEAKKDICKKFITG